MESYLLLRRGSFLQRRKHNVNDLITQITFLHVRLRTKHCTTHKGQVVFAAITTLTSHYISGFYTLIKKMLSHVLRNEQKT